ncbi:hypothetical protein [uncultured Alistipes sp.]|jgi:hypothetical protein|uniref:hypothetical protein n=1 Tax=uncultured Alistipes sp. TaxID=538949 RepID=UPI0025E28BAC|nr:hypothetical protein [uncultured Alistipes sp.]
MKRLLLFLLLAVAALQVVAQTLVYPDEREMPVAPKTYDNELGVRYGAQVYLGRGQGPELQAFSIDYARYYFNNIGFRTGLNVFIDEDAENYFSVPLQFTWRSKHFRAQSRSSDRSHYYNHTYYPDESYDTRSFFTDVLLSILPSAFEAHAGFTPGLMCGPFSPGEYSSSDPGWAPYTVRQRFSCTFDIGVRLIIPIWRFNLLGDFTYHCYLTDNFRAGEFRPSRSYMGLGVGLSFNF